MIASSLPKNNINLSFVSVSEINALLWEIENTYLSYLPYLDIDFLFQFGIELEYGDASQRKITREIAKLYKQKKFKRENDTLWVSKDDKTVHRVKDNILLGGEVVSPILTNDRRAWEEIKTICSTLTNEEAVATEETSTHIHIDQSILGNDIKVWIKFIKLWIIYEEVIYRFLFGEYPTGRRQLAQFAKPVRAEYLKRLQNGLEGINDLDKLITKLKLGKHHGINFMNTNTSNTFHPSKNTIELRIPNGTLEPIIIQNNILFFGSLLHAASRVSDDFLNQKLNELNPNRIENFNEIYIYDALELADILFTRSDYKMRFLRQYIKSYEIDEEFKQVNTFIKR